MLTPNYAHARDPMDALHVALAHAKRKHPVFAKSRWQAFCVLFEEVREVFYALVKRDRANLREELAQVACVCVRWLEWENERSGRRVVKGSNEGEE